MQETRDIHKCQKCYYRKSQWILFPDKVLSQSMGIQQINCYFIAIMIHSPMKSQWFTPESQHISTRGIDHLPAISTKSMGLVVYSCTERKIHCECPYPGLASPGYIDFFVLTDDIFFSTAILQRHLFSLQAVRLILSTGVSHFSKQSHQDLCHQLC